METEDKYTYTTGGKHVSATTYNNIKYAEGLAMDSAGHLIIADYSGQSSRVQSMWRTGQDYPSQL